MKKSNLLIILFSLTGYSIAQDLSPAELWYLGKVAFYQGKTWIYNPKAAIEQAKRSAQVGAAVGAVKGGIKSLSDQSWESVLKNIERESAKEALHSGIVGGLVNIAGDYGAKWGTLSVINGILKKYNPKLRFQNLTPLQAMVTLAAFDRRRDMFNKATEYEEVQEFLDQPGVYQALEDIFYRRK